MNQPALPDVLQPEHCALLLSAADKGAHALAKVAPFTVQETLRFAEVQAVVNNAYLVCRALNNKDDFEEALIAGVEKNVARKINEWTKKYNESNGFQSSMSERQKAFSARLRGSPFAEMRIPSIVEVVPEERLATGRARNARRLGVRLSLSRLAHQIDDASFVAQASIKAARWAEEKNIPFDRTSFEQDLPRVIDQVGLQLATTLIAKDSFRTKLQALFVGHHQNLFINQLLLLAAYENAAESSHLKGSPLDFWFRGCRVAIDEFGGAKVTVYYPKTTSRDPPKASPFSIEHFFSLPVSGASQAPPKRTRSELHYDLPEEMYRGDPRFYSYGVHQTFYRRGRPSELRLPVSTKGGGAVHFAYGLTDSRGPQLLRFSWLNIGSNEMVRFEPPKKPPKGPVRPDHAVFEGSMGKIGSMIRSDGRSRTETFSYVVRREPQTD